jgi:hypothetical protein
MASIASLPRYTPWGDEITQLASTSMTNQRRRAPSTRRIAERRIR